MSTLTKVFVVLLSVFSIAFTTMTVSIVSQTVNWRETAEKYQEQAVTADAHLRNLIAANSAELATARDAIKSGLDRIVQLESQLRTAQGEASRLKLDHAKASAEKSNAEAMNQGMVAQLQAVEKARAELQRQRDDLEKRNIELERRNIDLNDRVNEQTAQMVVLLEQQRQYEQQLNLLKEENEKLAAQSRRYSDALSLEQPAGAALPGVTALSPVAARAIRGHLISLSGNLVTLSVGSADGVKPDMRFVIHREDQYVGDVVISLVEPNQSAGRLVRTTVAPKVGDQVVDEVGLSGARGAYRDRPSGGLAKGETRDE